MKVYGSYKTFNYIDDGDRKPEIMGLTIHFSNGNRRSSSFFSHPSDTIDHAGRQYLRERGICVESEFQRKYFNKRYKEVVAEYYRIKNESRGATKATRGEVI